MIPDYAELRCVSNFTFLRGASKPEELVTRAKQLGYAAIAVVDECSLAGVVRAHGAAKNAGIKLLVGSQFKVDSDSPFSFVVLATNRSRRLGSQGEPVYLSASSGRYDIECTCNCQTD